MIVTLLQAHRKGNCDEYEIRAEYGCAVEVLVGG
jgi:hypothetical protein